MKTVKNIPVYKQDASAIGGVEVHSISFEEAMKEEDYNVTHMDDHYMFVIAATGTASRAAGGKALSGTFGGR